MLLGFWRVYCLMSGWRQILCPFASLGVCMFMQATVSHKLLVRLHSGRSPTNSTGTPPSSPSCCVCQGACARTRANTHTHTHCRGLSGWCVKAHWIYFWEWHWTQDHFSLPFSFLFCTLPAASSTTSPLTIPLSIYDGVILLWYYDLLLPPWFLILPPLPYPHPFYCKLCDWQLQLQVLRWAFTSAAWLSKNLTLPPASTPISTTGLSPSNRLQVRPKKRHPNHLQGLQLDTVCASKGELAPVCFISEAEWTWDCAKT